MAKKKNLEATKILESITRDSLIALNNIRKSDKDYQGLQHLLTALLANDKDKIMRMVGGVQGVDDVVKANAEQNYYRGRISAYVLINTLITRSAEEANRREREEE